MTILPCYSRTRRFSDGEAIVRLARSRRKIGMNGAPSSTWQARLDRRWYTELVPTNDGPVHELHRNDELLTWLGVERRSTIVPAPADAVASTPFAEEAYYVLIPGAGYPIRRWPVRQFASLAERISGATGWKCLICGGPEDEVIGREIGLYSSVEICNYAGRSSIAELVEIIRGARLVVGNETGAIHIAAAVSTPAVSITGGGHFGRFVPYPEDMAGPVVATRHMPCFHCDWNCVYPLGAADAAPCVAGISVDAVWTRVERALAAPIGETIMKPDGDSGDVRNY